MLQNEFVGDRVDRLSLQYNPDGTSEYLDGGWQHVEPPLHWNEGHPNEVWTNWTGVERVYDAHGLLRRESFVLHSRKWGRTTYWNDDGSLAARGNYREDLPLGRWFVWDGSILPYVLEF